MADNTIKKLIEDSAEILESAAGFLEGWEPSEDSNQQIPQEMAMEIWKSSTKLMTMCETLLMFKAKETKQKKSKSKCCALHTKDTKAKEE